MRRARFVGAAVIVVVLVIGGLWMLQERLIYFPAGDPGPPPASWESLEVASTDGVDLTVWVRLEDTAVGRR